MNNRLQDKAFRSLQLAAQFYLSQHDPESPGWGTEPGKSRDAWTTSQVLFVLNPLEGVSDDILEGATRWLQQCQNMDGSWGSATYGHTGDVPATAWATQALVQRLGPESIDAQRGLSWLLSAFDRGWTTVPSDKTHLECHLYSTAMAVRALVRGPKNPISSLCVQEGLTVLHRARQKGAGWGFQADRPSDPTFTAYVAHGLLDAATSWGIDPDDAAIKEATEWLVRKQNPDGSWKDWHGLLQSPEATGYIVYLLIRSRVTLPNDRIEAAVRWLCDEQMADGGWPFDCSIDDTSNNWVTHTVLLGLKAFWLEATSHAPATHIIKPTTQRYVVDTARVEVPIPELAADSCPGTPLQMLYRTRTRERWGVLPQCRPLDHTMFEALDRYVQDKLPTDAIYRVLQNRGSVQIHGIYPDHVSDVRSIIPVTDLEPIAYGRKSDDKRFNYIRPSFWKGLDNRNLPVLVVTVSPGKDYLFHYAMLVRHFVAMKTTRAEDLIHIFRYPSAEHTIPEWSGLDRSFVLPGERIMLGYVEPLNEALSAATWATEIRSHENSFYASKTYRLGRDGPLVTTLGTKYCYWGSMCQLICNRLCVLGATEIVYFGKLGALTKPIDIYSRIFCPSRFVVLNHSHIQQLVEPPANGILAQFPNLDTGMHVSVPTVLEEDYVQRGTAGELEASSIDNEISQIALGVTLHNRTHGSSVQFSAVHFATDYIRRPDEQSLDVAFDLGNDKTEKASANKRAMVAEILDNVIIPYLRTSVC